MLSKNGAADCSQRTMFFQQDTGEVLLSRKEDLHGHHRTGTLLRLVGESRAYPQPTPSRVPHAAPGPPAPCTCAGSCHRLCGMEFQAVWRGVLSDACGCLVRHSDKAGTLDQGGVGVLERHVGVTARKYPRSARGRERCSRMALCSSGSACRLRQAARSVPLFFAPARPRTTLVLDLFQNAIWRPRTHKRRRAGLAQDDLSPATREELISSLSFTLRFARRKRTHQADDFMARIAAEHLVDHLTRSGFVVRKRPPSSDLARLDPRPAGSTE